MIIRSCNISFHFLPRSQHCSRQYNELLGKSAISFSVYPYFTLAWCIITLIYKFYFGVLFVGFDY